MNNILNADEMLETGKSAVKQVGDQIAKQATATQSAAANQLAIGTQSTSVGENQPGAVSKSDDTKDIVKNLYGVNNQNQNTAQSGSTQIGGQIPQSAEDAEELAKTRKQLLEQHMTTYWKPTFEPVEKREEETAEKVDREKQEEESKKMEELQEEEKKNEVPLAIRMGSQKAEKYPGASG
jgi:hypothetical protein